MGDCATRHNKLKMTAPTTHVVVANKMTRPQTLAITKNKQQYIRVKEAIKPTDKIALTKFKKYVSSMEILHSKSH